MIPEPTGLRDAERQPSLNALVAYDEPVGWIGPGT